MEITVVGEDVRDSWHIGQRRLLKPGKKPWSLAYLTVIWISVYVISSQWQEVLWQDGNRCQLLKWCCSQIRWKQFQPAKKQLAENERACQTWNFETIIHGFKPGPYLCQFLASYSASSWQDLPFQYITTWTLASMDHIHLPIYPWILSSPSVNEMCLLQ